MITLLFLTHSHIGILRKKLKQITFDFRHDKVHFVRDQLFLLER